MKSEIIVITDLFTCNCFLFITDKSYSPHPFCLVIYYIPEGFIPKVMPHGNSKSEPPLFGTLPSTFKANKEKGSSLGPKAVVASVGESAGVYSMLHILESYLAVSCRCPITSIVCQLTLIQKYPLIQKAMSSMQFCY